MKDRSLKDIRLAYEAKQLSYQDLLEMIKTDSRKGLIQLIDSIHRQRQHERQLMDQYHKMMEMENRLHAKGIRYVAGLDEVGRGPLAGPVVTAAVILDPLKPIYGLRDSKKLSQKRREELAEEIAEKAIAISFHEYPAEVIDKINILEATKQSMLQAISGLSVTPEYLLIDALHLKTPIPQSAIVKGDDTCLCISAASVIAKVYRDRLMREYHEQYPEYGFDSNVGYGTSQHTEAIKQYGPTPIHRKSFIRQFL